MSDMLHHAVSYTRRGWPVFPCWERDEADAEFQARVAKLPNDKRGQAVLFKGKRPRTTHGLKDASTDEAQVTGGWKRGPSAAVGVPTGPDLGPDGAFVLDVDLPAGPDALAHLEAEHGPLPPTLEQRTGSGGRQLFFLWPKDREIRNSAGKLGSDLDTRGAGGYVVVPPSGHPSGGRYAWTNEGVDMAEAPAWLLDLLTGTVVTSLREQTQAEAHDDVADADLERIVGKCAWLRHCRDEAAGLPEPEWYAALSVLVRCKDGGRLAHDWSQGHPKYTPAETDAKLKQAMDKAGPRTCESIRADFGACCNGCVARVKSPIVLGRVDRLPDGFQVRDTGIYYRVEDSQGNISWEWVCSPLRVLALTRNGEGREWGRLIEVVDPDGQAHRWAMPMEALAGSGEECRRELLSMGLRLAPGKGPARLHTLLSLCRPSARARCVSRIGWHGRRFVLPDVVYGVEAGESVLLQAERAENPFRAMGTLSEWQEAIGLFCVGNSRLVLSVSAALAAPLLYLAGAESGGLHLVGGSSQGKTTALVVAGSVCGGGGVRGYILQWRATANGLEGVAAAHCDALVCLDELAQVTPQAAGEAAYMLTNGTGKTRASRQGTARKPAEWRVLFLSTGEITLGDKIREDGKSRAMAGQLVRVVDIDADAGVGLGIFEDLHGFPDGAAFSNHLNKASKRAYGVALRAFLEKLTSDIDEVSRVVPALIKTFTAEHCPAGADGQVKRVCNRFALVAAGGECGAAYGVLPWPKGEATQAAARCFRDWLAMRGGTGASEIQAGLAQVRAFFQAHGSSRFETWGDRADESKTINRAGFRRKDELTSAWEYFVPPAAFKAEIARGHDTKRLVKELVERGLVIPGQDGQPASGHRIPGQPFTRYYRFAPGIVSDDPDISKNTVATVAPVASSNDAGSSRNRPATAQVAPVAPDGCNRMGATAATERLQPRLQEKGNDSGCATVATDATAEKDNSEQKAAPVIDMKPAEGTGLWTGPAEVEL